ncbi:P2X purinoceptor 5 isoform X1 [Sorex fumeus]|uniref:P2X purinoceptor 5 isoform X1 n=1 Tax=Sorex fumeus TaxID=62283 RepID=UPI0024AD0C18|nr:P2X purinoceptor 5 isoform X1 [Sorex fumeus]
MGQGAAKQTRALLDYTTEKYVVTKNRKVGLIHRLLQLGILLYMLVWVFLVKKGYQETDTTLQSSVITKVKGVVFTNTSELGARLWDIVDFVIPPQGENMFFITTNLIATPNQRQQTCAESSSIEEAKCHEDSDCPPGEPVLTGHGVRTGRCLPTKNETGGTCEIFGWCPLESECAPEKPLLSNAENFTVYIKNYIHFPKFNFSKSNVLNTQDTRFLRTCRFNPANPYCPIFRLGSLVSWTGNDFNELAVKGGVIRIEIQWDCDLDKGPSKCKPQYYFSRLDKVTSENTISSGYSFRYARYYRDEDGVEFRTMMKAYGIRFHVIVSGKAGKFSIIPTVINVGSGLAILGAASFFCDLILMYLIKRRHFYRNQKYEKMRFQDKKSLKGREATVKSAEQPKMQDRHGGKKELLDLSSTGQQGSGPDPEPLSQPTTLDARVTWPQDNLSRFLDRNESSTTL